MKHDPSEPLPRYLLTKLNSFNETSKNSDVCEGYWVTGVILNGPTVGEQLTIIRDSNIKNPDGKYGIFNTSPISILDESNEGYTIITTRNSQYKLELIPESKVFKEFYKECKRIGFDPFGDKE
jgi:hypothetical protein